MTCQGTGKLVPLISVTPQTPWTKEVARPNSSQIRPQHNQVATLMEMKWSYSALPFWKYPCLVMVKRQKDTYDFILLYFVKRILTFKFQKNKLSHNFMTKGSFITWNKKPSRVSLLPSLRLAGYQQRDLNFLFFICVCAYTINNTDSIYLISPKGNILQK